MSNFDFISNDAFRRSLEADRQELASCLEHSAWKAVHVLAGSMIEALLIDFIIAGRHATEADALKLDFGGAIKLAKDKNLIADRTYKLSEVIKDYRNLIHPGRAIRTNESITGDTAILCKSLLNIVLEDLAKTQKATYGYTAEQLLGKITKDSGSESIILHLLKETKDKEVEKLLTELIPAYLEKLRIDEANDLNPQPDWYIATRNSISRCYKIILQSRDEQLRRKISKWYLLKFKEESEAYVYGTLVQLFQFNFLIGLAESENELITQHVLDRYAKKPDASILTAIFGIGSFLNDANLSIFVDRSLYFGVSNNVPYAIECFQRELAVINNSRLPIAINRLGDWVKFYRETLHDEAKATKATELKTTLQMRITSEMFSQGLAALFEDLKIESKK